jgi:uncharacterized cupredoxin-like copper-binding protein
MRKAIMVWWALFILIELTGCGAPSNSSHDDHSLPAASGVREIQIEAKEFGFAPKEVRVKVGEKANLVLNNKGALEHDLNLESLKLHVHTQPGKTTKGSFTAPTQPCEYEIPCAIAGHKEQGMTLKLIVE